MGGILSPKLYNLYSITVGNSKLGIQLGKNDISIIMYAEDLTIVADDASRMSKMLRIVGAQGSKDDIKFNAKKSIIMCFNGDKELQHNFKMYDEEIPVSKMTRYLGYQLNSETGNDAHIQKRKSQVAAKLAYLKTAGLMSSNLIHQQDTIRIP